MEKIIIFILIVVFSSCSKKNETPDSVPKSYIINLKIVNSQGDDLLNTINDDLDLKKYIQIVANENKIVYSGEIVYIYITNNI